MKNLEIKKEDSIIQTIDEKMVELKLKANGISENILNKANILSQDTEFNQHQDNYVLRAIQVVSDMLRKDEELELKKRNTKTGEAGFFANMLKDANSGNLTKEDISKLSEYVKK